MRDYDTMSTNSWVSLEQIHSTTVKRQMFLFQRLPNTPRQILVFGKVSLSSCMYTYGASTRAQLESYKLPTLGLLPLMDLYRLAVLSIVYLAHILPISFFCVCERRETHTSYRHLTFYMSSSFFLQSIVI